MLFAAFIFTVAFIFAHLVRKPTFEPPPVEREAHAYSGLNPELYGQFLANIRLCREYSGHPDIAIGFLYKALGHLENLGLYTVSGDLGVREEITELVQKIGASFELYLNAKNPKYLNNTLE